jgi:hypothetical protein
MILKRVHSSFKKTIHKRYFSCDAKTTITPIVSSFVSGLFFTTIILHQQSIYYAYQTGHVIELNERLKKIEKV